MKQFRIMFHYFCFIIFSLVSMLTYAMPKNLAERTPVPVKVTVTNQYWVETISICNNTTKNIPLADMEFNFNYAVNMPNNIWGQPWAAWRVASQKGNAVVLLGGAPWVMPVDPNCQNPLTIQFNASPTTPAPTGPFVFKVADDSVPPPPTTGQLKIAMPTAPVTGLANPTVSVQGPATSLQQTVSWGNAWQLNNLTPGNYTVTSSSVSNGTDTYEATPLTANVTAENNTQVTLQYTKKTTPPPMTQKGNGAWVYDRT